MKCCPESTIYVSKLESFFFKINQYLLSSSKSCPPCPMFLVSISEDDFCLEMKNNKRKIMNFSYIIVFNGFRDVEFVCPYLRSKRLLGRHLGTAS